MKAVLAALCFACPALSLAQAAITLSGSSSTAPYARAWAAAFEREHPTSPVRVLATSSSTAVDAMAASPSTIGMLSRPMRDAERSKAAGSGGKAPVEIKVVLDAVGIYVHKDNPLPAISIAQIKRVFSAAPGGAHLQTWGQLGLNGRFAKLPIRVFGFDRGRGAYEVLRELALGGAHFRSDIAVEPVSSSVVQAVGVERGGIGYASVYFRTARTRLVPVGRDGGPAVAPTEEAVMAGHYPLVRHLYLYLGAAAPPAARELVRFALSEQGQALVRSAGGIPIARELAAKQREALP
jgi:phosphate transport system substrate-binding protein